VVLLCLGILIVSGYGFYKYKNRQPKPDYFNVYETQNTVPVGKLGVFIITSVFPSEYSPEPVHNYLKEIFENMVPWPFRRLVLRDRGVVLLDHERYYELQEFTPTRLEDPFGNDRDIDGVHYIEKYKKGELIWMPPSKMEYLGHGCFLYTGRKGGMPTAIGKHINTVRIWCHKGIVQKRVPQGDEHLNVINGAFDMIGARHRNVECRAENSMFPHEFKKKFHELLEAGCDTIVLGSTRPIYFHLEHFRTSFRRCFEYADQWQRDHPDKKIKMIMAPPISHLQPMRQAYLEMLKDRLDALPEGSDVTIAVAVHGMPWDSLPYEEAWLELAPPYRDKLFEEAEELLARYKFGRTRVVHCQDEFAEDPNGKYLSTNRAYWDAVNNGYDYVISLPIAFIADNTDTMFYHAVKCYHKFDQYNVYDPIDYPDWSVPYSREFVQGKTRIIYSGCAVGKYQQYVIEALYQSFDSILSKREKLL